MDALLLLALDDDQRRLCRPRRFRHGGATAGCAGAREREVVPFVYAGAAILRPALFQDAPQGAFSLTACSTAPAENGRLYGLRLEGVWMHVGTPEAIREAEAAILQSVV